MKTLMLCLTLACLAGCGAAGDPFRPTASAGVSVGTGGVSANCSLGTTNGTLTIGINGC